MNRRALIAAALAAPALAREGLAQSDWPSRSVTIIVPFATGGPSDIIARLTAQHMQQALGRPFVVENRPGAIGGIGARQVIRAAPDGHTLMHAPISTWAINVALRPNLDYDPVRQLTRIMQTVRTPNVLVVHPGSVPATDLAGLLARLRAPSDRSRGRNASYSTSGAGSSDHLTMEMFKLRTQTDITHIPYAGGGPAMTSAVAGTTQLSFQNLGAVFPHIQAGRLRPILITGEARAAVLPDVPTAAEEGLADFVVYSWQAYGGPPEMPSALVERIHAAITAALRSPAIEARLIELGFEVPASRPEAFAAFQEREIARWREVVQRGGITAV
jgi:tripartite-type tricarboxylate transporter receptor subunit TctC